MLPSNKRISFFYFTARISKERKKIKYRVKIHREIEMYLNYFFAIGKFYHLAFTFFHSLLLRLRGCNVQSVDKVSMLY